MHEPLKNKTYLGKKLFFNFFGANFVTPKSSPRHEKQPVLGLAIIKKMNNCILQFLKNDTKTFLNL